MRTSGFNYLGWKAAFGSAGSGVTLNQWAAGFVLLMLTIIVSFEASAITAPAAGSFGYDMYDIFVNKILKGAPGFVGGVAGIIYSATKLSSDWKLASLGVLASSAALKADTITTSLGYVV